MNDIHDADKGNPSNHKTTPLWVVNLVRGAKKWGHFDVLEHVIYSFEIKDVSRVLSHQLVRHRMASYSQISARIVATRGFSLPDLSYIYDRKRRDQIMQDMTQALSAQWDLYDHLREKGVRPEDARYIVGEGQTTSLIMTLNARSLAHIIRTRLNPEAQWEIRELASTLLELVKPTAPIIWEEPLPEGI
jgi:thymidylate synthase (FAD)